MTYSNERELNIEDELNTYVTDAMRSAGLDFLRLITFASPVDTGRFRSNWNVGFGSPDTSTTGSVNFSATLAKNESEVKLTPLEVSGVIWFSNNLPYAVPLNSGTSKQAPQFFVETAARRAEVNINSGTL
jgi:hypothetical protein